MLTISARNRVYLAFFNTKDHKQRGQIHHQLSVSGMLYIHSESGKFKELGTCAGVCRANGHTSLLSFRYRAKTCFLSEAPDSLQV